MEYVFFVALVCLTTCPSVPEAVTVSLQNTSQDAARVGASSRDTPTAPLPTTTQQTTTTTPVPFAGTYFTIGAVFQQKKYPIWENAFHLALQEQNTLLARSATPVRLRGVAMPSFNNTRDGFRDICDMTDKSNISVFLAIGDTRLLNGLGLVSRYQGLPLLAYNTDQTGHAVRVSPHFSLRTHFPSFLPPPTPSS